MSDASSTAIDAISNRFSVGVYDVDFLSMRISRGADVALVEPKVLSVLRVLIDRAGEVVTRDELIDAVWGNRYGGEERLSRAVSLLRKALGDVRGQHQHIETVPKTGYRLIANVATVGVPAETRSRTFDQSNHSVHHSPRPRHLRILALAGVLITTSALAYWMITSSNPAPEQVSPSAATVGLANPAQENSIAVLPFTDLSPTGDQQYFSDGLAEEILDALASVQGLSVAGRTSSFAYRNGREDIGEIGNALRVNFLLEGSVRRQDDKARVTTQLVRVADGYQVWSKTFDGDLRDIFEFQESVARAIAAKLNPSALNSTPDRLARRLTSDREAYELYLQGREMSRRFGRQEKLTAIELLSQAVERDPGFADAWAWLARSQLFIPITNPERDATDRLSAARFAVEQALNSDPNLAMGHYVNALLHDYDLNFDASFESMERAYAAAPNQPFFAIRRGFYHLSLGYVSDGAAMIESGLRMDPTDALGLLNLGQAKIYLGDVDAGLALIARSESLGFAPANLLRCIYLGTMERSRESYQCWQQLPPVIKARYPTTLAQADSWDDLGRIFAFTDKAAMQRIRTITVEIASDLSIPMSNYLFGVLQAVGDVDLYMQTFIDRPFLLNASALRLMWFSPIGSQFILRDRQFPEFAQRLGLTNTWRRHGWPDDCRRHFPEQQNAAYCE